MLTAKISSTGQITLPKSIRRVLEVKPGERVLFVVEDRTVLLRPMGLHTARSLAGAFRPYARAGQAKEGPRRQVKKEISRAAAQEGPDAKYRG